LISWTGRAELKEITFGSISGIRPLLISPAH
jgi:hypothetical protein